MTGLSARRALLTCGVLSAVLYVGMNIFIPMLWESYSMFSLTVSELSAIDAPTRPIWFPLGVVYAVLFAAFGAGVWLSAVGNRPLRIAGLMLILNGLLSVYWPPMHQREILAAGGETLTDTLHLVWAGATVVLMLLALGFGGFAMEKRFRLYSIATIVVLAIFGLLTSLNAPAVEANLPTPWAGLWERINIGAFLLWTVTLAVILLRKQTQHDERF